MIDALPFMRLKFADEHGLIKQFEHIDSERLEVQQAFESPESIEYVAEELADLAQSAVTALYIIERQYGIHPLDVVVRNNQKNIARGYDRADN